MPNRLLPPDWLPDCDMDRVILHWNAGTHDVSELDLEHYHLLVDGEGNVHVGEHSIKDNVSTGDDDYAVHTKGCNTKSIGVAVCCMGGARQNPFYAGKWPMTEKQWETMARVTAELCHKYQIPIDNKHVLGHGEVQRNLGIKQNGKWDPCALPWAPSLSVGQVMDQFRGKVKFYFNEVAG